MFLLVHPTSKDKHCTSEGIRGRIWCQGEFILPYSHVRVDHRIHVRNREMKTERISNIKSRKGHIPKNPWILSYHHIFKNMGPTTYIFKNTWNCCFHLNCNNVNKAESPHPNPWHSSGLGMNTTYQSLLHNINNIHPCFPSQHAKATVIALPPQKHQFNFTMENQYFELW